MSTLEELKKEADDLGVQYHNTIGANKLVEKIETHYAAQETSGKALQDTVSSLEKTPAPPPTPKELSKEEQFHKTRIAREKAARKTRIVRIIDNDARVNNHATTCSVNCSNSFFDLGTIILPLNERIEVAEGHIKTLQIITIPQHIRDPKTGLSNVRMRPRYTISNEGAVS
jgi:hypothetical protein